MKKIDSNIIRKHFPALSGDWTFFDNAGGTQTALQVGDKIQDYLFSTNVQLGASYEISQKSGERVDYAQKIWANAINANSEKEIVFGSSTTALLQNLSRSLVQLFLPGDEVIVTNCDHEANIGPWINMQKAGIVVKSWKINLETFSLELDDLEKLMSSKTRLVAFTHASNVLGTINPVEEITKFVHEKGALVCVDGVAYTPHRQIDVKKWDVDFYVFSLYKVFGPHYSLLFGKEQHLNELPTINHFFIGKNEVPYKLQPGNVNYELSFGTTGIIEYFETIYKQHFENLNLSLFSKLEKIFDLIATHEENLIKPLIDFLKSKPGVKIVGEATSDRNIRVATVSFFFENRKSSEIPLLVDMQKIGIRWGDFYARRLIENMNLHKKDGIIRISMVHYNTIEEVERLIDVLDNVL
ncbi:MAG: cysteine desulfurase-like protein [Bacteroidetes bacterium]|jgi:cysteine desulfurase family protein (TIGR01976 family)|nr:cysteine desulfurase-like protein [Bacteroidota bacterium]MBT6687170.1 cysteine desulfurase-like protein [Bacteroidota bacterium]MBT7144930.1 cysteine desulfurase-like protein [Bacteroidota bacterium]MBT7492979.1 cysteine desulfurase-like protein [Bacteroidota bacterium]